MRATFTNSRIKNNSDAIISLACCTPARPPTIKKIEKTL